MDDATRIHQQTAPVTCIHPGCERPHHASGWCQTHYDRSRRGIDMDKPINQYRVGGSEQCQHEGCELPRYAKGWCAVHYQRSLRGTDMNKPVRASSKVTRVCTVPGCGRPRVANGLCNTHNNRQRRGTDMNKPVQANGQARPKICTHPGCDRSHYARGLCKMHYGRQRENRPMDGPAHAYRNKLACAVPGCERPYRAGGYCFEHYVWGPAWTQEDESGAIQQSDDATTGGRNDQPGGSGHDGEAVGGNRESNPQTAPRGMSDAGSASHGPGCGTTHTGTERTATHDV